MSLRTPVGLLFIYLIILLFFTLVCDSQITTGSRQWLVMQK